MDGTIPSMLTLDVTFSVFCVFCSFPDDALVLEACLRFEGPVVLIPSSLSVAIVFFSQDSSGATTRQLSNRVRIVVLWPYEFFFPFYSWDDEDDFAPGPLTVSLHSCRNCCFAVLDFVSSLWDDASVLETLAHFQGWTGCCYALLLITYSLSVRFFNLFTRKSCWDWWIKCAHAVLFWLASFSCFIEAPSPWTQQ